MRGSGSCIPKLALIGTSSPPTDELPETIAARDAPPFADTGCRDCRESATFYEQAFAEISTIGRVFGRVGNVLGGFFLISLMSLGGLGSRPLNDKTLPTYIPASEQIRLGPEACKLEAHAGGKSADFFGIDRPNSSGGIAGPHS